MNVSINGNGERWQNIFLDVNSAQLYLLTPFTSKPKTFQKSQPHRYLSNGDIYSHEGVDKNSTRQTSATHTANESGGSITMINSPLRSNHKRLPSVIMGSNGEHRSTTVVESKESLIFLTCNRFMSTALTFILSVCTLMTLCGHHSYFVSDHSSGEADF